MSWVGPVVGALSGLFGGFFQTKQAGINTVGTIASGGFDVLKQIDSTDGQIAAAQASQIAAEYSSESWITRTWRPLTMWLIVICIVCYFFGYVPPNLDKPMPPMMTRLFDLFEYSLIGGYSLRTVDKITRAITHSKLFSQALTALTSNTFK